jgi:hypothetical protein
VVYVFFGRWKDLTRKHLGADVGDLLGDNFL